MNEAIIGSVPLIDLDTLPADVMIAYTTKVRRVVISVVELKTRLERLDNGRRRERTPQEKEASRAGITFRYLMKALEEGNQERAAMYRNRILKTMGYHWLETKLAEHAAKGDITDDGDDVDEAG